MGIHTKSNLYTVIKNGDLVHLTETERQILGLILNKLSATAPDRKYYVVNTDEPYSHKVLEVILDGEEAKGPDYKERVKDLIIMNIPLEFSYSEGIDDKAVNHISFSFTSYPLLGKLEEEITPAIESIVKQMTSLGVVRWKFLDIERLRDTYSFQDVYTGRIIIETKNVEL